MEDFVEESMSYAGFLESSAQDKCARTLISCYTVRHQFPRPPQSGSKGVLNSIIMRKMVDY